MGTAGLARREGDELDTTVRVEGVCEGLRKRVEPADECLAVLEVREALAGALVLGLQGYIVDLRVLGVQ